MVWLWCGIKIIISNAKKKEIKSSTRVRSNKFSFFLLKENIKIIKKVETELNTIKVGIGAEVARLVLLELLCSISARPVLEDDTTSRGEGFFIF